MDLHDWGHIIANKMRRAPGPVSKVIADEEVYFYKPLLDYGYKERAVRKMDIYRRLETLRKATGE